MCPPLLADLMNNHKQNGKQKLDIHTNLDLTNLRIGQTAEKTAVNKQNVTLSTSFT